MSEKMSAQELHEAALCIWDSARATLESGDRSDLSRLQIEDAFALFEDRISTLQREADGMRADAEFLLERLSQFEGDCEFNDETYREWGGHVIPAIERLRKALPPQEDR